MACTGCDCIDYRPSVSLDAWRRIPCFNPYYFWQMAQDKSAYAKTPIPIDFFHPCNEIVYNSGVQGGSTAGRDEIWAALLEADAAFREFARYWAIKGHSDEK